MFINNYNVESDSEYFSCSSSEEFHSDDSCFTPLNETLNNLFKNNSKNFNIIHINAQSIPAHYPDMLATFESKNIHAILVSESWLKPCLASTCYSLPGFRLIRNDRIGKGGGGVAIFLRSNISFQIINVSTQPPTPDITEHILLEVQLGFSKILIGAFYNPSMTNNYFTDFEQILDKFTPSYKHIIIMGDFNTCLLKNDYRSKKFVSLTESCNLHILPLNATHSVPGFTPSLLDLAIISSPDHVCKYGQFQADAFSHHDLIYVSYLIRPPKWKPQVVMRRSFGGMNIDMLQQDAAKINWSNIIECKSVDDKIELFNSEIIKLFDIHAPIKPIKIKHLPAPWLTEELKLLIKKKNRAKAKLRIDRSDTNIQKFKLIRNRCNTAIRDAQRRHIHNIVENGNPSKTWKLLKSLGLGKSPNDKCNYKIDIDQINQHFSSSFLYDNDTKANTLNSLIQIPSPNINPFNLNPVTDSDVRRATLSISSTAVGSDGISRGMIVPLLNIITPVLTNILNHSLSSKSFPKAWKSALIIPLPKKSCPSNFSDYRPISLLPFLSKVLEKIVHSQLSFHLYNNNLLNPFQSGFRPGHSTVTALTKITDDIRMGMDNRLLTILGLLDFSNAFNTVDIDVLLSLMHSFGITESATDWFRSYLLGRRQRVTINETVSAWCDIRSGVPQGGVLSPLLFSMYINSITREVTSQYHMYADDFQIYTQAPLEEVPIAISRINADLEKIADWSTRFGLSLNLIKSQFIIIGSPYIISRIDSTKLPKIELNRVAVPLSTQVKNLGIYIDNKLSWSCHVMELSKKIYAIYRSLNRLRNFLPISTKVSLAQSLILPILDYADTSFFNLTEDQLDKLERLQNFAIRFVFGLRKYDHVSTFRAKLNWLPIRSRRNAHTLNLLYSILFDPKVPEYLKERFTFLRNQDLPERSTKKLLLKFPRYNSVFYKSSFTFQAVKLWNSLPVNIRQAKSKTVFRKMVHDFYFKSYSL